MNDDEGSAEERMVGDVANAIDFGQRLLDVGIEVVRLSKVELDQKWARNPKVVALALLCRSLSNFRAAIILAHERHVMEARTLVRCLYENLLWVGALRERGDAFVQQMISDDAYNKNALAQLTLKLSSKHGGDANDANGLKLRSLINELIEHFPTRKKLRTDEIASITVVELAYVEFGRLSLDSAHCSVTALGRHLSRENIDGAIELITSVEANVSRNEKFQTILHACRALIGVAIAANELVGFTGASEALTKLVNEFEANGWMNETAQSA